MSSFLPKLRLRQTLKSRREKLCEFNKTGDMKAVTRNLIKAQEKGLLSDHKVLLDTKVLLEFFTCAAQKAIGLNRQQGIFLKPY